MADLFIIKERLKFSLKLTAVFAVACALAAWYFRQQPDFAEDPGRFLVSIVTAGAFVVGWLGILVFYVAAHRMMDPSRHLTDPIDEFPWRIVATVILVVFIGSMGVVLYRYSDRVVDEFALIRKGQRELLEERLEENPALVERKEKATNRTLLVVAFEEDRPGFVSLLLEHGANPEELLEVSANPLVQSLGSIPMLKVLLAAGFNPEAPDAEGVPPMHHAVSLNSPEVVDALLASGAKVDARDILSRTSLMRAVESDDLGMMNVLMERGAGLNEYDRRGDTPLHKAVRRRNPDSVKLLLEKGADPKIFNFIHYTPLHIAAINAQDELVKLILEHADIVNLYDGDNRTALEHALTSRKYDTAELLIEHGADVDRILAKGDTILHEAILDRDYRTARFLIRNGADVHIQDANGVSAHDIMRRKQLSGLLDLVAERDHPEVDTNAVESVETP